MKKEFLLSILAITFAGITLGQMAIKIKLADQLYNKYAYMDAIPFYEDLATKDGKNAQYLSRLGDCYRLTGNSPKAEAVYSKLIGLENVEPVNYYYYALMLDENQKYSDAQKYYGIYKEKNSSDSRSNRKTNLTDVDLFKDSAFYRIKNCEFNSINSDFALFPFSESSYMFASNRPSEVSVKHTYVWNNQPFLDLYTIKKNTNNVFAEPKPLPGEVNSQYHEGPIFFDKNSNTFYITRNNFNDKKFQKSKDGVNKLKIYIVNIDGTANKSFADFEYNNNEYSVGHVTVSADGQKLYFSSDMPGGFGLADLYVCKKENDKWGKPENLGNAINTEGNELFPFISENGTLYFSSEGNKGLGGLDIYSAEIASGIPGKIKNLGYPLNSNKDDFAFYISPDNLTGYFSSNRAGGKGDDDIYEFTILKKHYFLSGTAMEKGTMEILPNTKVKLSGDKGITISEIITGNDGSYKFEVEPEMNYQLNGQKEKYFDGIRPVSTINPGQETEFKADLILEKDLGITLYGLIVDKATKTPLENVKILITESGPNTEVVNLKTPVTGDFRKILAEKKIHDVLNYQIKLEREGYLSKTVTFNAEITHPGEIKLHEALDIALDKIEIGTDIGKLININPIYFDLAKWNIRKDATIELDKIVKVMGENPTMEIELGSHTDCRSGYTYNMDLSDKRAKASAEYIKKKIENPARIFGKGYGESKLVNKCECEGNKKVPCSEEEHQMNRRTEFKVVKY